MKASRNGRSFVVIVPRSSHAPDVWDPHVFAHSEGGGVPLQEYATAGRPRRDRRNVSAFSPIEYRHIPPGDYLTVVLEPGTAPSTSPSVPPGSLLIGTMRAYLGNILVTPQADWVGIGPEGRFAVKSEFLLVEPADGLVYFWAAFMRTQAFLSKLPPGGGGTRPRLSAEDLLRVPVSVPDLTERAAIDERLGELARAEWELARVRSEALATLND